MCICGPTREALSTLPRLSSEEILTIAADCGNARSLPHQSSRRRCTNVCCTNLRTSIMNLSSRSRSMPNHSRRTVSINALKYANATCTHSALLRVMYHHTMPPSLELWNASAAPAASFPG